jgi:hypothetical protein
MESRAIFVRKAVAPWLGIVAGCLLAACGDGASDGRGGSGRDTQGADGVGTDALLPDGVSPDGASPDGLLPDGAVTDAFLPDGAPCRTLEVTVEVDGPVVPGEDAAFSVSITGASGNVTLTFSGGTDGETRPEWVDDPQLIGSVEVGRYSVAMKEPATLAWTVEVTDECGTASGSFELVAAFPRVAFLHLAPSRGPVRVGAATGIERLSLTVLELDEAFSVAVRDTDTLRYGEVSLSLEWPTGTLRAGIYPDGEDTPITTWTGEPLTPGRDHLFVFRDEVGEPRLDLILEPERFIAETPTDPEADPAPLLTPAVILHAVDWGGPLTLRGNSAVLVDAAEPRALTPFMLNPLDPHVLSVADSALRYGLDLDAATVFPASPAGGAPVVTSLLVDTGSAAVLLPHVGPDGALALFGFIRTSDGSSFPLTFDIEDLLPLRAQPAVLVLNALGAEVGLRDSLGRPVGAPVPSSEVSPWFTALGLDASTLSLLLEGAATPLPDGLVSLDEGARNLVCLFPADSGIDARLFRPTGSGAPRLEGDVDWVVASALASPVEVTPFGDDRPTLVAPGDITAPLEILQSPLVLTLGSAERRNLSVPLDAVPAEGGRIVIVLPPALSLDEPPVVVLLNPDSFGGGLDFATRLPSQWTPYFTLQVWDDGPIPRETAAPYPSAAGWVPYGADESGRDGYSYRLMMLSGAPSFRLDFAIDLGTQGAGCADTLVLEQITGNTRTPVVLDGRACGRAATVSAVVSQGQFSVGVASNRLGSSDDSGEGGPWYGWRLEAITPILP